MIAIIQNDPEVPPGTLTELLDGAGARYRVSHPYRQESLPAVDGLTGVIVLGGAMGVHDEAAHPHLGGVRAFMKQALRLEVPLLGICLGGQLLAHVLGGHVTAASPHGEKGLSRVSLSAAGEADPLFAGVPASFTTFQWHGDSFLPPAGALLLAGSPVCPWQAFRCGSAVGVQFHPEVDRAIVACWCAGSLSEAEYLAAFDSGSQAFQCHNRAILTNFIRQTLLTTHP